MIIVRKKLAYIRPESILIHVESEGLLERASGNAGTIAPGQSVGDAKRWNGFMDEEDEDTETSGNGSSDLWED